MWPTSFIFGFAASSSSFVGGAPCLPSSFGVVLFFSMGVSLKGVVFSMCFRGWITEGILEKILFQGFQRVGFKNVGY